ncbi:unnamed protein product [Paramecium pentaurelia]|uniref:Uncharacterized protein n=1 Tax=Paramecium pentaurelia TaxID=43138 RepID=A0A8S1W5W0_9CILI|nr:unnamed protein product [Paramecium pentaurelia]
MKLKNKQIHQKKIQFIAGKEDASNNYFRGYTLGRNLIYDCLKSIRKEVEKSLTEDSGKKIKKILLYCILPHKYLITQSIVIMQSPQLIL